MYESRLRHDCMCGHHHQALKNEVHRLAYAKGTATDSWYRLINVVTYEMAIRLSVLILRGGA